MKRSGGRVIVRDEASSDFFGMPGAVIATADVDHRAWLARNDHGHDGAVMLMEELGA